MPCSLSLLLTASEILILSSPFRDEEELGPLALSSPELQAVA